MSNCVQDTGIPVSAQLTAFCCGLFSKRVRDLMRHGRCLPPKRRHQESTRQLIHQRFPFAMDTDVQSRRDCVFNLSNCQLDLVLKS